MQFISEGNSFFRCLNKFNTIYSTFPDNGLVCGSRERPFKFKGGFLNSTLKPHHSNGFDFLVRFKRDFNFGSDDSQNVVFEFGLTTAGAFDIKFLRPEMIFSFTVHTCLNKLGFCMVTGDGKIIDVTKVFASSKKSPTFTEGKFRFGFRPESFEVWLFDLRRNEVVYTFTHLFTSNIVRPVFGAYGSEQFSTTFTILSKESFHRKSLHPSLYISTDNKVVSNRKTSITYKNDDTYYPYIFTKRNTFRLKEKRIGLSIEYEVQKAIDMDIVLEMGFGIYKNGTFHPLMQLKLIPCYIYRFYLYKERGYCLREQGITGSLIVASNPIRLLIHYHSNGTFDIYIEGFLWNFTYLKFQFVDINVPPRFYVKRHEKTEIKIITDDTGFLLNMGFPLAVDYVSHYSK